MRFKHLGQPVKRLFWQGDAVVLLHHLQHRAQQQIQVLRILQLLGCLLLLVMQLRFELLEALLRGLLHG